MNEQPMPTAAAVGQMRMLAADISCEWPLTGPAQFIQGALDSLLAGVDSPSLHALAGLGRNEHHEARELFDSSMDELGFLPLTPENLAAARWAMARWWADQIVERNLDPVRGANLIWQEAACELDQPADLQVFVRVAQELVDDAGAALSPRQEQLADIVTAAHQLLGRPGPDHDVRGESPV
ncbi:hypothetical protein [Streptomyces sp. NPDC059863]|uniref:hypothetical protein n=1 Tax=unclassified Streptomyces TaxID=2593676 RepID=UPI003655AF11